MDADIAENTAHEAAKVNTTKNFTATMNTVAVIKPGHVGPVTEEEKAEIAEEVAKEVHDVGIKDEIGDEVTATVKVGDAMSKALRHLLQLEAKFLGYFRNFGVAKSM